MSYREHYRSKRHSQTIRQHDIVTSAVYRHIQGIPAHKTEITKTDATGESDPCAELVKHNSMKAYGGVDS
jgi:hypothetical protein